MKRFLSSLLLVTLSVSITYAAGSATPTSNSRSGKAADSTAVPFGETSDGTKVQLYTLKNKRGMEAKVADFGATLVSLKTPDRTGQFADVVLGFDDIQSYEKSNTYFGGTIGRYGNRIAKGTFTLNGVTYHLSTNNGINHLHGGIKGFNRVLWHAKQLSGQSLELTYASKDGEEGYPGTLYVKVTYTIADNNELRIAYQAQEASGKDTIVNLTNHSYFNLSGNLQTTILDHQLTLFASHFTPVDAGLIPTGELRSVKGAPFDFTTATAIGARIDQDDEQIKLGHGYDHNFVIDRPKGSGLVKAAEVYDADYGRVMEVYTTEPGVQFYSGNNLNGSAKGKGGQALVRRSGLCLETQHYPDSPNKPTFPTTTLKAGQRYSSETVYRFSVR